MKTLKRSAAFAFLFFVSASAFASNVQQEPAKPSGVYSQFGLQSIDKSEAYQDFLKRPVSEASKIIYLIERFRNSEVEIDYGGHYYKPKDITCLVRMFIASHFDPTETAQDWIMKYANRTIPTGQSILIRSNGQAYQSKDILLQELNGLEKVLSGNLQSGSVQH